MASYSPQTDALMQRLRPAGAAPGAVDPFARGGQVRQLPTNGTGEKLGNLAGSAAVNLAGRQVASNVASNAAQQAAGNLAATGVSAGAQSALRSALTSGASGAAAGAGISMATDALSNKLRVKEDMPTFGGPHGAITDEYGRRFEGTGGGTHANAVKYAGYGANPALAAATGGLSIAAGALFGIGKAAATRNAKSAYTDFRVEDAADALRKGYQQYLGREASDDEVMGRLVGQGWNPNDGSRWVGEKNLFSQLDDIKASDEAKAYAARGGAAAPEAGAVPAAGAAQADPLGAGGVDPFSTGTQALQARLAAPAQAATQPTATTDLQSRAQTSQGDPATLARIRAEMGLGGEGPGGITGRAETAGGLVPEGAAPTAVDSSAWNTDGYAAPAYTAANAGSVPDGWDATKWGDPNHQTPKYAVGRILSQFPPTVDGLAAAFPEIEKAYPGATFNGKDKLTIPGVGTVDVLKGASKGGEAWRWGADDGAQQEAPANTGGNAGIGLTDASGGPSNQQDVMALIAQLIGREGQKDAGGLTQALMNQLRATA